MAFRKRASALDVAAAVAGGVFFSITTFFMLGAVIWAGLTTVKAPLAAIGVGEALAGLAALIIGAMVIRNAVRLATLELA
jgi:ABC-type branched-subunit amino acid transport system permease subunit